MIINQSGQEGCLHKGRQQLRDGRGTPTAFCSMSRIIYSKLNGSERLKAIPARSGTR